MTRAELYEFRVTQVQIAAHRNRFVLVITALTKPITVMHTKLLMFSPVNGFS